MSTARTYMNCVIFRNTVGGNALRWSARTPAGTVSADTLAGIKEQIRAAVK